MIGFLPMTAPGAAAEFALAPAGAVRVDVSARYPLADLARVHELSAAGGIRGKVVITIA